MTPRAFSLLRGTGVAVAGTFLALASFVPFTYGRTLWEVAAEPVGGYTATATVTVIGPTPEQLQAFLAAHPTRPAAPASGLPVSTGDNRTDLAVLLVVETALVSAFFYLNRPGAVTPFRKVILAKG